MTDEDIDLYADDPNINPNGDYKSGSKVDLYDDAITAPLYTYDFNVKPSVTDISPSYQRVTNYDDAITGSFHAYDFKSMSAVTNISPSHQRVAVYVGNLTWWTTDQDLTEAMARLGVKNVCEIEFYAYRSNGRSKGFCTVVLGSENSLRIVMQKLPRIQVHGRNPIVTKCTWRNREFFEYDHGNNSDERFNRKRRRGITA